ncbi:hypothetical protein GCM10009678_88350 [Actinomadura kijaniata]|uniref:Uncharacterized protein n=1 Tax=Actinomadura namibiensis TaxID=182080 RepID=A0A7W3LKL5_ACTNM|nr:hypothetical protein [Actinomadura namibiensis]MBA8949878.1 hypothetical protein [Actinomadura namibiensis]
MSNPSQFAPPPRSAPPGPAGGTDNPNIAQPQRQMRRIGLWGAPESGKTTFLAALQVAVLRSPEDWMLYGVNEESNDFLDTQTALLTQRRRFPSATADSEALSWTLRGTVALPAVGRFRRRPREAPLEFNIDLLDSPGVVFASRLAPVADGDNLGFDGGNLGFEDESAEAAPTTDEDRVIEHLAGCDGIIYLFDPTRERRQGDAYSYFQRTLLKLSRQVFRDRGSPDGRLPQHLAVCVTKFDAPEVYRRARLGGYLTYEDTPQMLPRVREDSAGHFFQELCRDSKVGNADLVLSSIQKYFHPDRVRYFATSAVGFYLGESDRFTEQDNINVVKTPTGEVEIRGKVWPINVVEPVLWLGQRLPRIAR